MYPPPNTQTDVFVYLELDGEFLGTVLVSDTRVATQFRSTRAVEVEGARGTLGVDADWMGG